MVTGFGFCSNCGSALTEAGQRFCSACGFSQPLADSPAAPVGPAPAPAVLPQPPVVAPTAPLAPSPAPQQAVAPPPTWSMPPTAPAVAVPARTTANPTTVVVGIIVIAAIVAAGVFVMNNSKGSPNPSPGKGGVLFGSAVPTGTRAGATSTATRTPAVVAAGAVTFEPASFSCADTEAQITMTVWLPASVPSSEQVTAKLDDTDLTAKSVATDFEKQADGRWLTTGTDSTASLCGIVGEGKHLLRVVDSKGSLLAQGSFTVIASATPTPPPVLGGTITIEPASFSCSDASVEVTLSAWLPASVTEADQVTGLVDGGNPNTEAVGDGFDQQADGRWLSTSTEAASTLCGSLAAGKHTLTIIKDADKQVLASGSFTLLP
jgi:hypothetical protein